VNDSSLVSSREGVEVDLVAAAATEREFCKVEAAINIVGAAAREMPNRFLRGEGGIARGEGNVATLVNAAVVVRRAKVDSHSNCATKINENDRGSLRVGGCIMFGFFWIVWIRRSSSSIGINDESYHILKIKARRHVQQLRFWFFLTT
jgi:hypothetical protein